MRLGDVQYFQYHFAMEIDNPPRSAWRNFPDVLIHARESAVKKHADYLAAKSGEITSARRVVEATLNDNMVNALGSIAASSNPVLASVHAYEAAGINRIPAVFAEVLAERLGLRAEAGIVQSNRTGHNRCDRISPPGPSCDVSSKPAAGPPSDAPH